MEMHEQPALVPDENNQVQDSSPVQETVNLDQTENVNIIEQVEEVEINSVTEEIRIEADETSENIVSVETIADNDIKEEIVGSIVEENREETTASIETETVSEVIESSDNQIIEEIAHIEEDDENEVLNYHHLNQSELIQELIKLVSIENVLTVKNKIGEVRNAFIQLNKEVKKEIYQKYIQEGGDAEKFVDEPTALEFEFNNVFKIFKDKKAKILADQEADKVENLKHKQELLEKLRELINSESTLRETYNDVKELQEKWREIGHVPPEEHDNLWKNYHFLLEKFFDKVKINNELRDLDLKKNLELKIELAEKAEELLLEKSINKSFKLLQEYHAKWKDIGPVPQDKSDEIWERFKNISDKINARRREHYDSLIDEQKQNYILKTALCEKAEEILTSPLETNKDWQEKSDMMNSLLEEWKTLGPAPKKLNDEIWERFKGSLNTFYDNKKEVNQKFRDEQTHNYNLKLDICRQAEAIMNSQDWKKTSNELIKLQNEWKSIGPVPRKHSDRIWKQFRAACDYFFNAKSEFFKNINTIEAENLKLKEEIIEKVKQFEISDNKEENLSQIKEFQRQWMEIGRVPINDKNRLQADFRNAINQQLDKLKISQYEIENMQLKNRIDQMGDKREADLTISKEIYGLQQKVAKIKADINLWDNNIGFLANSKNAELLKAEIDKKIDRAKKEIEQMNTKIKYLEKLKREGN